LQIDSVNDRTHWPIPRALATWRQASDIQGDGGNFFMAESCDA
jgi:hypothetical protein